MVMERCNITMGTYTQVNGEIISSGVRGNLSSKTEITMMEILLMVYLKVMESWYSLELVLIRVGLKKATLKVLEDLNILMDPYMKVIGKRTKSKALGN